jgi:hypothetical protein
MVYSNILSLNHNTTTRPALQERCLVVGTDEHRLLLPWFGALPGEVAANTTVEAPPLAGAVTAPTRNGTNTTRPVVIVTARISTAAASASLLAVATTRATVMRLLLVALTPPRLPLLLSEQ